MAETEREQERLRLQEQDAKLYYDYEGRFIKQNLEQRRLAVLPRVVKPPMFARGGHALGDVRVFDRYAVGPLASMTCRFVELAAGGGTDPVRGVPSFVGYVLSGDGWCEEDGERQAFAADDLVVVPPYTRHRFVAGPGGCRLWIPETRLWHVLGLLWHEQFAFSTVPEGCEPLEEGGRLAGWRVRSGTLGLPEDLDFRAGANPRLQAIFEARRRAEAQAEARTDYDWFLSRLAEENRVEREAPRVIRGADVPREQTRQGRLRFYVSRWNKVAARDLDVMAYEVEPGGHTGRHRHIFEELLLVVEGRGHDVHEETRYPWEAGDLICVPMMTSHQHVNDGPSPARLVAVWPRERGNTFLGGIEQLSDASGWSA